MNLFYKYCIKTSFLILLFITAINNLVAVTILNDGYEMNQRLSPKNEAIVQATINAASTIHVSNDTVNAQQNDNTKATESVTIPADLLNTKINFQINSYIYYLNIRHFINTNAKKSFIQGWLKEKELHRLSINADSLRKAYTKASDEQREKISAEIITSEQESMVLNEQVSARYEKAREEENAYWQSASMDEINRYQQKISKYEDSIAQTRQQAVQPTVPDTITMYLPMKNHKEPEPATEAPTGIIYKIQIGAYKGKIPDASNKLIKKISLIRKVENDVDDKGVKVFTTGNLRTFAEAETMLNQVKQEGIKNAVIAAYQNGKKITVAEARKINKEL